MIGVRTFCVSFQAFPGEGNAVNLSVDSGEIFPLTRKCEIASR